MAAWFTLIVLVALTTLQGPAAPSGSSVVSVSVIVPEKFAGGVYVTVAGVFVAEVLLNVPPPDVIDHVPVVAPPPIVAPINVIGVGVADWQAVRVAPAFTVAAGFTVIVLSAKTATQGPAPSGSTVVNLKVTVPLKFAGTK